VTDDGGTTYIWSKGSFVIGSIDPSAIPLARQSTISGPMNAHCSFIMWLSSGFVRYTNAFDVGS